MSSPLRNRSIGLRCDAGHSAGVGHAVRLLALGEELQAREAQVVLLGTLDVAWLREAYASRGIETVEAPSDAAGLTDFARRLDVDAVVLDGYDLDPACGASLLAAGRVVLAMVDSEFGAAQEADVYVDQNLGAQARSPLPDGSVALAGIDYALFRDAVLDRRRGSAGRVGRAGIEIDPPRALAVFGGTDPFGAATVLTPLVLATEVPVELTVVSPDPDVRTSLEALPRHPGQIVQAVEPLRDLPAVAAESDLAISASGSSIWELLCLGVPTAAVCVVDNQEPGYAETVQREVVSGLGRLDELRSGTTQSAIERLRALLTDADNRAQLAARGQQLVDGQGRMRVVDALEEALTARSPRRGPRA